MVKMEQELNRNQDRMRIKTVIHRTYMLIYQYPYQAVCMYSKSKQIRNDLKAKDTNLRQTQNRKQNNSFRQSKKPECQNPSNHKLGQNTSNSRGPNRRFGLNNIYFLFFETIKHCMLHYIVNKVSGLENKSYGL